MVSVALIAKNLLSSSVFMFCTSNTPTKRATRLKGLGESSVLSILHSSTTIFILGFSFA